MIPPNLPTIRKDELDLVYKTSREKFEAVIEDIRDCHEARPAGARRHHLDRELRS